MSSPAYEKGCLFTVWTKSEWDADEEISFDALERKVRLSSTQHSVSLGEFQQNRPPAPSKFDSIRRIYVEEFGGNTGLLLREHVIGDLANSARFVPVEEPGNADAFIRGRSDSQQQGTKVSNSGTESGSSRSGVSAVAIAGSVFGSVRTRGQAASSSTSVSENVISETISLRLTVPSGDVIWGWDETKPCVSNLVGPEFSMIAKARCAVQDLTGLANQ